MAPCGARAATLLLDLLALLAWAPARPAGEADGGAHLGNRKPCSGPGRPSKRLRKGETRGSCRHRQPFEDDEQDAPEDEPMDAPDGAEDALANTTLAAWARWLWGAAGGGMGEDGEPAGASAEDTATASWAKRFLVLHAMEAEQRAMANERSEERKSYINAKIATDRRGIRQYNVPYALPLWPSSTAQVAFLFLTMDELDFEKVWDRFFSEAPAGRFSIYFHRASLWRENGDQMVNRSAQRGARPLPLGRWGAVEVPPVKTGWCALMGAEVALLAAATRDARNQQFVFLSHNTVPLKGFDYVYRHLAVNSPSTSKFCLAEPAYYKLAYTETIRNELRRTCVFRDFYRVYNPRTLKHHQWIVLARNHAEAVVRRAEEALNIWRESWEAAAPDLINNAEGCSDEAVPIAALLHDLKERGRSTGNTWGDLTRLGVEQQCLTYVLWRHCFGDTELEQSAPIAKELGIVRRHGELRMLTDLGFDFFQSELKRKLNGYPSVFKRMPMEYLSKLVNQGFMFARKFVRDIEVLVDGRTVPLDIALSALWQSVDEKAASERIWSRLSTEGVPTPI